MIQEKEFLTCKTVLGEDPSQIEADHEKMKRLNKPTLGFKSMESALSSITGFEVMRMFKKGQFDIWGFQGVMGELRLIESQFGLR